MKMKKVKSILLPLLLLCSVFAGYAQQNQSSLVVDYAHPRKYIVGGIKVEGIKYLGEQQIIALTGLREGMEITIPGEQATSIVNRIWGQRHFSDVSLNIDSLSAGGDTVFLRAAGPAESAKGSAAL